MPDVGANATRRYRVREVDTAAALGSGDLEVLATPRLLAWCEAQTIAALEDALSPEVSSSVGTRVRLEHLAPSGVGSEVEVTARLVHVDGRLLRFEVLAVDESGGTVGHGEVTRVVVGRERFLARVRR